MTDHHPHPFPFLPYFQMRMAEKERWWWRWRMPPTATPYACICIAIWMSIFGTEWNVKIARGKCEIEVERLLLFCFRLRSFGLARGAWVIFHWKRWRARPGVVISFYYILMTISGEWPIYFWHRLNYWFLSEKHTTLNNSEHGVVILRAAHAISNNISWTSLCGKMAYVIDHVVP